MSSKIVAVVPAAGIGSRMNSSIPKQYLKIHKKTIFEHTLEALLSFDMIDSVVAVLHPQDEYFSSLGIASHPKLIKVIGGNERVDSVLAGLKAASVDGKDTWVMVHDAARPMIQHHNIKHLVEVGKKTGAAILATPSVDTLKQAESDFDQQKQILGIRKTIDRKLIWQAQTPQFAKLSMLIDAIESCPSPEKITDEASALEMAGHHVSLVEGDASNIKITKPSDLALAEFYLRKTH
ncbi:2-C-methyl-D-erythritol 4-phosphate cytidylyltransferase [Glaciecola sp. KUL10]|uniref:2-C-methyl-D-erythritol 4-phosphate cytidylyltransferase n=1 Tax=Glaciecola sp. (strain KUL10) TaxID=2161813 RepID=UPI000D787B06|nr:2-C-methyl-D-erythritol 4-phosphate cytidylyltransferase [Glaciecola sp. KUL10]GBL05121.1 2-C-methyl-D-erythritol 4-phosphate cytidylyltransferase [Glaciecola sp. KUL10]